MDHLNHLKLQSLAVSKLPHLSYYFTPLLSKTFQNRRVSSADAVHIVELSGASAICKTL